MSRRPSHRFYLADLVMVTLLCGLLLALVTSARTPGNVGVVFVLIWVVAVAWAVFHARRQAPTCEECGRRFIRLTTAVVWPGPCPHCGREQHDLDRSIRRWKTIYLGLLGLLFALGAVSAVIFTEFTGGPYESTAMFVGLIVVGGWILTLLAWFGVGIYPSRLMRPKERPCEACGSIIPLEQPAEPTICPQCRQRHLRPDEVKKEQAQDLRVLRLFLLILGIVAAFLIPRPAWSASGLGYGMGIRRAARVVPIATTPSGSAPGTRAQ